MFIEYDASDPAILERVMSRNLSILLLIVFALFMLSCEQDSDSSPDTDYDFLSFTDFNEWYQSHTWAVNVTVLVNSEPDDFMYVLPELECFMDNIVSANDTFDLSINGTDVPLDYYNGNVFVDPIGPDITMGYAPDLHIIFQINGTDKINKRVVIPSAITMTGPENTDFTSPVSVSWTSAKTPDYQSMYTFIGHRQSPTIYHSAYFYRMISKHALQYTLPASEYLSYFHEKYGSVEDPAYLEVYTIAVYARNFEEQNNNVVSAEVIGDANLKRYSIRK